MEWKDWKGKTIFVKLKGGGCYTGKVTNVDLSSEHLIFISIIDKFGNDVMFEHSEVVKIVEEKE